MKILRVIVDEMPMCTSQCDASTVTWEPAEDLEKVACQFRRDTRLMTIRALTSVRCPDCPLRLEHDLAHENQVAMTEVM